MAKFEVLRLAFGIFEFLIVDAAPRVGVAARAMTYTYVEAQQGDRAYIARGPIEIDERERFITATSSKPASVIFLESDGGYMGGGVDLAEYIRAQGYTVIVPNGYCASACFLVYAAARQKGWEPGAYIGVHRAKDETYGETAMSMAATNLMAQKLGQWGVPPQIAGKLDYTAPGKITWLTEDDLRSLGPNAADTTPRLALFVEPPRQQTQQSAQAEPPPPITAGPAKSAPTIVPGETTESMPSWTAGFDDRAHYEASFATLTGDTRDGATFWAAHRSDRPLPPCIGSTDFMAGCRVAQSMLAPMDARRRSDPSYRRGFNSYATDQQARSDGLRDRTAWEDWFGSLSGATRDGALWWSGERSKNDPETCENHGSVQIDPGSDGWLDGCRQARARLTPADQRRLTEPDYRSGWNSYRTPPVQTATNAPMPNSGGSQPVTPPPRFDGTQSVTPAPSVPPVPQPAPEPATPKACKDIEGLGRVCLDSPETTIAFVLGQPNSREQKTGNPDTPQARSCDVWHYRHACHDYRIVFEAGTSGSMTVVSLATAPDSTCQ